MPPRKTQGQKAQDAEKATAAADAELIRREAEAAVRSRVAAQGVTLQKLDADGALIGEPQHLPGVATVSLGAENPQVAPVPAGNIEVEFETSDPATIALVRELTRIPIPTAVINEWFPAFVRPPGEVQPWATCKVFLTPQGLYVYRAAPQQQETFRDGAQPDLYAAVDFVKTAKPVAGYAAMNAGIPIHTGAGKVIVQPAPGCGCSARKLKNWTPTWARNRISWADAVKLADPTAGR
jgi:hypothetical protein